MADIVCRQALDITCAGAYERSNASSRSGPACRTAVSAAAGLEPTDSMTALHRHIGLGAERQPDVLRGNARIDRGRRRAVADRRQDEVAQESGPSCAELVVDGAQEFTAPHALPPRPKSVERELGVDRRDEIV